MKRKCFLLYEFYAFYDSHHSFNIFKKNQGSAHYLSCLSSALFWAVISDIVPKIVTFPI